MYVKETGVESVYQIAGKGKLICDNSENICELVRRFIGMDTATAFEAGSSFCGTSEVESRVSGGFFAGIYSCISCLRSQRVPRISMVEFHRLFFMKPTMWSKTRMNSMLFSRFLEHIRCRAKVFGFCI